MPQKSEVKEDVKTPYFFNRRNPAPLPAPVGANALEDIYDFDVKDGQIVVVKVGVRDPGAEVEAAKTETIQELLARQPGKTPKDKLCNAVLSGIVPFDPAEPGGISDLTGVGTSMLEHQEALKKGKAAAASLPDELKTNDREYIKVLEKLTAENILNYIKSQLPKEEPKE